MSHQISQAELAQMLADAATKVTVGAIYEHYKSQRYQVTGLAIDEATDLPVVVYQAQYGQKITFTRLVEGWLETVEYDGQTMARFTKITT